MTKKMANSALYAIAATAILLRSSRAAAAASFGGVGAPAFAFHPHYRSAHRRGLLSSAVVDDVPSDAPIDTTDDSGGDPESVLQARNRLLALSATLAENSPSGRFLSRPADKRQLQRAVRELESLVPSAMGENEKKLMLGNWTLIVTANLPSSDIRRRMEERRKRRGSGTDGGGGKEGWFKNAGGKKRRSGLSLFGSEGRTLNPIQKSIQKTVEVTQRIRDDGSSDEPNGEINRVDNVIEYTPLNTLEGIIPEESPLYNLLSTVDVNPLKVKKSRVALIHKAEVESVEPVLRTKIAWTSSVLNVAGTSQYLDPDGEDVFGINNLFGDFVNTGTFDTPFVDEDIRISRTSGPVFEQLRVFVRKDSNVLDDADMMDLLAAELRVEEEREVTQSESQSLGKKVADTVGAATSLAENARDAIEKDMEGVADALVEKMDDVAARVQDAVEEDLERIDEAVQSAVKTAMEGEGFEVAEAISNVTKAVAKVPGDVRDIVEEDAKELGEGVGEALDAMVADVQDSVESDLEDLGKTIEEVRDVVAGTEEDERADEEEEETEEE